MTTRGHHGSRLSAPLWATVAAFACSPANGSPAADTPRIDAAASGSPDTGMATNPVPPAGPAAGDSVTPLLETGCSGGVTGGGSGTFLTASGHFYRFRRGGPAPNAHRETTLLGRDSVRAAAIVQAAERKGITLVKFSQPSNMTCFLSLDRGGTSYEVAWPIGTSPTLIRKLVNVAKDLQDAAGTVR
jgi:hypothetical protein